MLAGPAMEGILDFSIDLDIGLLDQVVKTALGGFGEAQARALGVLNQFQEHPESWKRVDAILERAQFQETKIVALIILEKLIKSMWKALPEGQRLGIRKYIVAVVIKTSSDDVSMAKQRAYLKKLNEVLVQILKHEWPRNWPTFITEIVQSSRTSLSLCENNMAILKLLSEEIFDFSAEQMTLQKQKDLKNQMCNEFSEIFKLCFEILEKAARPSLVIVTLSTLERFLSWIPLGYIFETDLIGTLHRRFFSVPEFRNVTLKCFTEIAGLQGIDQQYDMKFVELFTLAMTSIMNMIPIATDLDDVYANGTNEDENFIQNLNLYLTTILSSHLNLLERQANPDMLLLAHEYLLKTSLVQEREVFKVALEYWTKLVAELYDEIQRLPAQLDPFAMKMTGGLASQAIMPGVTPTTAIANAAFMSGVQVRSKTLYPQILTKLRFVMIERMVKPEEVLIIKNDEGEIVRERTKETDTITLYKSMREVLVYLTHLDVDDTETIMNEKLARQIDGTEWSWDNLNKLCWAIGSISGAMNDETEKKFLVAVIKDLLGLVEQKRGKDNKAVVASNIMYIVGQYPRFLKAHWKFLKTVVNKLFEFMHEKHEGVQDMACDTFIKIAQKCKRHFVMTQAGELMPYIEEILMAVPQHTADLSPQQVHTFYEAIGHMVSAQPNKSAQERLVQKLMELPNQAWESTLGRAAQNPDELRSSATISLLSAVLKTNVAACASVGPAFFVQMRMIYNDMLALYKACSELFSATIASNGPIAVNYDTSRGYRTIKKETLRLVETYVNSADELPTVAGTLVPPLLETVLSDYKRNIPLARDAEVLNAMAAIVTRLMDLVLDKVPIILEGVFECTLDMITKDFTEFPEIRPAFYRLLHAIQKYCFPSLLLLQPPQFKLYLDSVVWGFKHTVRDISDMGLDILYDLLVQFAKTEPPVANSFFQTYFLSILQDVFYVLTNTLHKSGFRMQTMILMQMFQIADSGVISVPLFDPRTVANPNMTNQEFLQEYVMQLLQTAFPHLQASQIRDFVVGLLQLNKDQNAFKIHLRDFLIQLKEFAGDENSNKFFIEEREEQLQMKRQQEIEAALRIPGMVKPHDRPEEMMD
ncbi:CRM1 C terminal-domain-containing protein [Cladochytrium replicatum]|nr:CRM1 C terminal-domain-containing protein [Cladochytrium replicatum]